MSPNPQSNPSQPQKQPGFGQQNQQNQQKPGANPQGQSGQQGKYDPSKTSARPGEKEEEEEQSGSGKNMKGENCSSDSKKPY